MAKKTATGTAPAFEIIDFTDEKALDRAIEAVATMSGKLAPKIHSALVACLHHALANSGGTDKLNNLYSKLGDHINKRNGVDVWLREFTSLEYRKNKAGTNMWLFKKGDKVFMEEGAITPFYTMKKVKQGNKPAPELFAAFVGLIARFEKLEPSMDDARKQFLQQLKGIKLPAPAMAAPNAAVATAMP
jgi:hypothetical protein